MANHKEKMLTMRINEKLLSEYKRFCDENSLNMSSRIRKFMEKDMEPWQTERLKTQNVNCNKVAKILAVQNNSVTLRKLSEISGFGLRDLAEILTVLYNQSFLKTNSFDRIELSEKGLNIFKQQ